MQWYCFDIEIIFEKFNKCFQKIAVWEKKNLNSTD